MAGEGTLGPYLLTHTLAIISNSMNEDIISRGVYHSTVEGDDIAGDGDADGDAAGDGSARSSMSGGGRDRST
jgi:hypothetical protein